MTNTITSQWVIGSFTGERAKSVKLHADNGIGYFIQQEAGAGMNYTVVAAFKRAMNTVLPEHLQLANPYQVEKLNHMQAARNGNISSSQ